MMYCPQCRVEYRPGFRRCSDCDVDLVPQLPPARRSGEKQREEVSNQQGTEEGEETHIVWEGCSDTECASLCRSLQEEKIEYRISETVAGRGKNMGVTFKYQIEVREADFEKARAALGYSEEDEIVRWTGEEEDQEEEENTEMELPAQDDGPVQDVHGDWNPGGWFPEDAVVEVWKSNPEGGETVVEMSLKENRISYRIEVSGDFRRVFVMPGEEARAREIVREVVEGVPPE